MCREKNFCLKKKDKHRNFDGFWGSVWSILQFFFFKKTRGVNIPVLVRLIFKDLFRFIPDIPGFYSGYSGTFSMGIVWTQGNHFLESKHKCSKMAWLVLKWNADYFNILQPEILTQFCWHLGSRKLTFLKKAKFLSRFIPDILVSSGYSGFGGYVLFRNILDRNIYPPPSV